MLTREQHEEFGARGITVVPRFLSEDKLQTIKEAIDNLQRDAPYSNAGRWDLRRCLPDHPCFVDLLVNETLLSMMVQLLGCNIKLLGSQVVKMKERCQGEGLAVDWHRDGGALSVELPEPLPPAFVKVGFCISGSEQRDGGELLMVPGSNCLMGDPATDAGTGYPLGFSRVLTTPGDIVVFDWRTWHAVSRNSSEIVRRTLYFTFGFRWLSPMDYQVMPEELLRKSPVHWQLLGGSTELGNYLPSDAEVPLRALGFDRFQKQSKNHQRLDVPVVIDGSRQRKVWRRRQRPTVRQSSGSAMVARAIRDRTT